MLEKMLGQHLHDHLQVARDCEIAEPLHEAFKALVDAAERAIRGGGKIMLFGNGGSAADAQHIAAELVGHFTKPRVAIAALALTSGGPIITAVANDREFQQIFSRQILALGNSGDLAIGITTSGGSKNVLVGLTAANMSSINTAAFTGRNGLLVPDAAEIVLGVPSA